MQENDVEILIIVFDVSLYRSRSTPRPVLVEKMDNPLEETLRGRAPDQGVDQGILGAGDGRSFHAARKREKEVQCWEGAEKMKGET
jgi:hypothetical protein